MALQPRSKKEVATALKKYADKFDLSASDKTIIVETLLVKLEEKNIINDFRYAKDFVYSISNSSKPRGRDYIKRFLAKKGIGQNIIDEAVLETEDEDELQNAENLAEKKLKLLSKGNYFEKKKKLWSYLARRGFSGETISYVIDKVLGVK